MDFEFGETQESKALFTRHPNMQLHERQPPEVQADLSLMPAHVVFIKVIELHTQLFESPIKQELKQCEADFCATWFANLDSEIAPDGA